MVVQCYKVLWVEEDSERKLFVQLEQTCSLRNFWSVETS